MFLKPGGRRLLFKFFYFIYILTQQFMKSVILIFKVFLLYKNFPAYLYLKKYNYSIHLKFYYNENIQF